ncbi:hypothetical protein KY386_03190 [Candidatus Parcubacteria bacterium]|nr:hypothetical protein [Candidatus Parcubacteria bacterium]
MFYVVMALVLVLLPASAGAVTADQLGPQSNSTAGADPGTANLLQPANPGGGNLQAPTAQEGGLQQSPPQDGLQPAGERDQITAFLTGESGGATDEESESGGLLPPLQLGLLAAILLTSGWLVWSYLTRRRQTELAPSAAWVPAEPQPSAEPELPPPPELTVEPAEVEAPPAEASPVPPAATKAKKAKPRRKKRR